MRILVLNYEFPPVGGGGGRFAEGLCRHLALRGHGVRVQTARCAGLPGVEERDGYTIHRAFSFRLRRHTCSVPEMACYVACNLRPASMLVRAWKPDVLHVHFAVPTGWLGWRLHRRFGVPYVLSVQMGDVPGAIPEQTDRLFRWAKPLTVPVWRDAAAVTCPSRFVQDLSAAAYGRIPDVVPNGIDIGERPTGSMLPRGPVRLVFVGRFAPQKNVLFLADVLVRAAGVPWEMDFVGDGPLQPAVRERIRRAGLEHRVRFHGWLSPRAAEDVSAGCDILMLPSKSEGLPMVGLRALTQGLAVLGSDVGGIQDIVRNGDNGFLCPLGDAEAFDAALRRMIADSDRLGQMKAASRSRADEFDLRRITERMESILQKASAGRTA